METARRSTRGSRRRRPGSPLFGQLLTAAVESAADEVAVRFDPANNPETAVELTYRQLDEDSSRLARELIERGIGPGDVVAIGIARSVASVLSVWAIAKTGAAYVPVDPSFPPDRIAHIVSDSGAALGLTTSAHRRALGTGVYWIELDDPVVAERILNREERPITYADRVRALDERHPAYIIYTSGSTGKPKGVVVTHSGLAGLLTERDHFGFDGDARMLHVASPNFDASVFEMLLTFSAGATLVIAPPKVFGGDELTDLLRREGVTHMLMTPGALQSVDPTGLDDLRVVIVGGEKVGPELIARWADGTREVYNAYGPTEATIVATSSAPMHPDEPITIGSAISGMGAFVLDSGMRLVPAGVVGELYLSGPALAQGYLNRPGLTAERFVASPFGGEADPAGSRLYRTGDLVRRSEIDGTIEYLGRSDFQVKIRGLRIELGEIDNALTAHPDVDFAATLGRPLPSGTTALVSYVLARQGATVDTDALTEFVGRSLPGYMVPAVIMVLDEIPLTPVGKLDRNALPEPVFAVKEYRAPATRTEEIVAEVFAALLLTDDPEARVGADDDFFELGGNSLLAVQAIARIGTALGTRVPMQLLFDASTVAGLAALLEQHAGSALGRALEPQPRPERIPLSYAQQRMWFLNRFDPASGVNNIPVAVRLSGALDVTALGAAVRDLVERHEVLRTVYPEFDGAGYQLVLPADDPRALPELVAEPATEAEVFDLVAAAVTEGFDVTAAAPIRLRLLALSATEHVLVCVVHHIAGDGFSMGPLTRDLMTAYADRVAGRAPQLAPLAVQYADFTLWQREVLGAEDDPESVLAEQVAFWRAELAGLPEQLELPADRPRPSVASYRGDVLRFEIDADLHAALGGVAQRHHATLFMVVHSALAVLLARLSGTRDIAIGTPVAGRGDAALDDVIGMFVNTLVLRSDVDPAATVDQLLAAVRQGDLAAFGHADLPFERLVELLDPVRSAARHPLFQVMLTFQNLARTELELPGLTVSGVDMTVPLAKFDLQLAMAERLDPNGAPAGISAEITYATDLFDPATVRGFADRFTLILAAIAGDPTAVIGDIDLLAPQERAAVLTGWNDTARPVPSATLVSLFERQRAARSYATALVFEDERLTYAEFGARVHRMARLLLAAGVGPGSLVALAIRRSTELVVAMYAVLEAGAGYVPLDPDQPADRVDYVLETARPALVLTTQRDGFDTAAAPVLAVDAVDLGRYESAPISDFERARPIRPGDTAYVIFTSGSTGRPKGVAVTHAAIVNRLLWMQHEYPLGADDVVLQKTPATFDVSVWEFFWPLQVGARLVVARPDGHRDPLYLAGVMLEQHVTTAHFVPSMLSVFVATLADGAPVPPLRQVFASGEALPAPTAQRLRELTGARLHNLYGPTEAAVDVTYHEVIDADEISVPIGRPVWNTQLYVLDSRLHPVAPGVAGELYLAGDQLALGYLNRSDLTADRFVANPYGPPASRMYRTGDLVTWTLNGELEYLGRTDFQVKLRGLRIELGEIEAALLAQPGVAQSVVVLRTEPHAGDQLVGYVVAEPDSALEAEAVRKELAGVLPGYMVPAALVVLDAFPLNPSGKLDRKALPAPVFGGGSEFRAPSTPIEQTVADVFAALLGANEIGLDDDFFALGGNSLLATRVVARLNAALDANIEVRELFEAPTVAALAARVVPGEPGDARPPLVPAVRPDLVPLSLAQQRMWVINQIDPGSAAYNIPFAITLAGRLDVAALQQAVLDVLERHEALRTRYPAAAAGDLPHQEISTVADTLPGGLAVEQPTDIMGRVIELMSSGFDVTERPPVRIALLNGGVPDKHLLVLVTHHIAADGASLAPLARDLMTAYVARTEGEAPGWAPLTVQYADYALWQREVVGVVEDENSVAARQLAYWSEQLAGLTGAAALPQDRPHPPVPSMRGASVGFRLPAEVHGELARLAREQNSSLFMVLHAVLAVLLARLTGDSDVAIGTPIAGRGDRALDDLVGMFVNTLTLRTTVDPDATFAELVQAARETDLTAFANADIPFERVVETVAPGRAGTNSPLFQAVLAFQNLERPTLELPGLTVGVLDSESIAAKFDLLLNVEPRHREDGSPAELAAVFTYAIDIFDEATVRSFARRLAMVASAVAADPHQRVGAIDLLEPVERDRMRPNRIPVSRDITLPQLLRTAVQTNPDGIAVVVADAAERYAQLRYADLDLRSTLLARLLIDRGIGPDDVVAVGIPRSVESVLAVWAVAKTGAAFVPVDTNYPAERIGHMVKDSGAVLGLTVSDAQRALPGLVEWLLLDDIEFVSGLAVYSAKPIADADRVRPLRPQHPAYVIYTSGSTGTPKGVVVTHAGLSGFCDEQRERYRVTPSSRTLHFASPSFDASVLELLLAVGGAATMVVAAPEVYGGAGLAELLRRERVTHAFVTPAALASMDPAGLDELRVLITGGEACPPELVRRWVLPVAHGIRQFFNAYGPTEATVMTNVTSSMTPDLPVTIGAPIRGIAAYVLDERLRPVPTGVAGELYVSGAQLARGYGGQSGLTASRFVADPFAEGGSRMYRTGDLVRWTPRGDLEYLGRNDFQVKVRGFRIELGEIDAVLAAHDSVDFAVTVGHELDSGSTILASYVHAAPGALVDVAALTAFAEETLPRHMVPTAITVLDEIPLTPAGKLDRRALPAPQLQVKEFRAPSGPLEQLIAELFGEALGSEEPIGADDDFFALGGNSLIATQVMARLGSALGGRLEVRELFNASTVAGLAARLAQSPGAAPARPALVAGPRPERIPLSPAQRRYWFLNQFDTAASAVDNIPLAVRLTGQLDVDALGQAIADVVARHEVLRTTYPGSDEAPRQLVHPASEQPAELVPIDITEGDLQSAVVDFALTTFDVTAEVPFAVTLFRLAPTEHVLAIVVHHVAADGASMNPLARDVMTAYAARAAGAVPSFAPLPLQYADYALWHDAVLGSESDPESIAAQQISYWRTALAGLPDQLELPTDRPRPPVQSFRGATLRTVIPADRHAALQELARANHASLFMVVHAALAVLLARLSGTDDIAVGTPLAGRGERELDDLIGMFVNTVVFRTKVRPGERFADLLTEVRERDLEAFANADVPFERLVEVLNPTRSTARNPLFQIGLSFQNLAESTFELPGLTVGAVDFDARLAKTDLQLTVTDRYAADGTPAELVADFSYATDLFDEATVRGFAERFERVLDAVIADAAVSVGEIDLLSAEESERILRSWNDTAHPVDAEATLVSLLDATVAGSPQATALVADTGAGLLELTYAELDARVNRLARYLIGRGVGPEDRVALAIRRSADLVIAMYAVAKAGAAYVPIDPGQPAERVDYILNTAAPRCVLTTGADGFASPAAETVSLETLDLTAYSPAPIAAGERNGVLVAANTAYVIFTSGSTGQPKGVAVPHAAIVNQLLWKSDEFGLDSENVVLLKTAATFDLSVWEFWSAAVSGGRLVVATADGHRDPAYLNALMRSTGVTTLHVVPSMLDALLTESEGRLPESLRRVLAIGEALPAALAQRVRAGGTELFNLYGPTEAAVSITNHPVTDADAGSVPIGVPEWNSRVYVLDAMLRPVPAGVPGELYLAGAQLARGYFARPGLTADRFVADPIAAAVTGDAGARMYRTGDLVVWNADGELEYRGRTDFQVKVRGFRIELGEIDAALTAQPGVDFAITIGRETGGRATTLVSYVLPVKGARLDPDALVAQLGHQLPDYMVPAAVVVLDELPLTSVGKVDRSALPEPVLPTREYRAPRTAEEEVIASVIGEVLGIERVGVDDDFFALGGDSVVSIQVVARARAKGVLFTPRHVFEARTVAALAAVATPAVTAAAEQTGELPLTPEAARLLAARPDGIEVRAIVLDVPADRPVPMVRAAIDAVLQQNPMLWVRLRPAADGVPAAFDLPAAPTPDDQPFYLLEDTAAAAVPLDDVVQAAAAALDPTQGRNIRFVRMGPDTAAQLVVVANGLVVDDHSWRTVIDQLTAGWSRHRHAAPEATESGLGTVLRALAAKAEDPAIVAELPWWQQTLTGVTTEPPAGADLSVRSRVSLTITSEGAAAVTTMAQAYHATVYEVLLTALAIALRTAGKETLARAAGPVVRLTADARDRAHSDLVGGFTTDYPLPLELSGVDIADALVGGPAAGVALGQIKELRRSVPSGGVGYGLLRHLNGAAELPAAGLVRLRYRDVRPAKMHTDAGAEDLLLDIVVEATREGLRARFDFAAAVFAGDDVKLFAEHWVRALGGLAEHALRPGAGGYTPSDFPLVRLTQSDLDRFGGAYPEMGDVWPMTPLQSGMLFHAQFADASIDAYMLQFVLDLDGRVNAERLRSAAKALVDRHANLRVAFADTGDGRSVQVVPDSVEVPWRQIALDHLDPAVAVSEAERIKAADMAQHFDMRTAPLLRFTLLRTATERFHLIVTSHHILLDGWSVPLLMRELLTIYALGVRSRHLPKIRPYRDYLEWLVAQDQDAARKAWRSALAGITEPTPLVGAANREISAGIGEVDFVFSPEQTAALTGAAARAGVTVNTVVQAAWALLIGRVTDRDDVVFGATVSGRPAELDGVETMVGLFLNAIPVRVRLGATQALAELLRTLQDEQAALLDYHYLGLSEIQNTIGVDGLFDSLVVFESYPVDREGLRRASAIDGMSVSGVHVADGTHYPVSVIVALGEQLHVEIKYLRDLFDEAAARTLADRLAALIGAFVAEPRARVAEIDALLGQERAALTARNATEVPELLDDSTLLSLFDAQLAKTPNATALIFGNTRVSYAELDARSRRLARELSARGVGPESLVAVAMRRGIDLVVAIYAVLRAGGAYVPVDPDHPVERSEYVLAGASPVCVLTTARTGFGTATGVPVVAVDALEYSASSVAMPDAPVRADNVAYVIYTSGSTGRPKGVAITHRQMANQFRWAQRTYPHDGSDVVLHKTPITFDISTWELFWPLQTGAAVLIAEPDGHRDPAYLARVIAEHRVSTVHFVPSMLDAFLDGADEHADFPALRRVFAAGEALSAETAEAFAAALPAAELVNWYGPAEATVVTAHPGHPDGGSAVPIGTPVANTTVHVLDRQLRPVPLGAAGELYVAGVQLARGYHGAPGLTAERFVAHEDGERLYRTGDVVRWRQTGDGAALEYLGRSDFQVKLRGQRVELGEIEAVLADHDEVRHVAVSLVRLATGDRLVAYVVPVPGSAVDTDDLLAHARAALPAYMVPSAIVPLTAMPLNASGKLDRRALPEPQLASRDYRAPATPMEQAVAAVFAEVLGVDTVGADDDFFDLGGNSLVATRAVGRLRGLTGAEVRVQWFFTDATVAALAAKISTAQENGVDYAADSAAALGPLLPIRGTGTAEPLFCFYPMAGLSWSYAGLVPYVDRSRPIIGLQSPALSEDDYLPESLDAMAARCLAEIRSVQPQGPYHLLGWSLGGILAHAVAVRLQAAGERVALLAMLDSHHDIGAADFRDALRGALAEIGIGAEDLLGGGDVHDLSDASLAALHATIPPELAVLTPDRLRRIYRSAVRSAELIAQHRPGVFRGRLEYFSARILGANLVHGIDPETSASKWQPFVDGVVADHPIRATHDEMTSQAALAEIGPRLSSLLPGAGDDHNPAGQA
ncbi:amino acid adenylation domain-containing protein [Nocardia amikacinitolerans]|uniref:amino acid adenylation domain-containing protein n=1 Tax=Nocardia amikacinitolerans TaxID=756689 RepID=UPI000BE2EA52